MKQLFSKRLTRSLLISLIIAILASTLMLTGFLNTWESKVSDAFYYPSNTLSDIIIVEIDDEDFVVVRDNGGLVVDFGYVSAHNLCFAKPEVCEVR